MANHSGIIIKKVFLGTLTMMILSSLSVLIGMIIDGVVIRNCLGAGEMAAYAVAGPVFVLLTAVSGIFSSAEIRKLLLYSLASRFVQVSGVCNDNRIL